MKIVFFESNPKVSLKNVRGDTNFEGYHRKSFFENVADSGAYTPFKRG